MHADSLTQRNAARTSAIRLAAVVSDTMVRVFVADASPPCLALNTLSGRKTGLVGLWVGNGSGGDFANLRITPV